MPIKTEKTSSSVKASSPAGDQLSGLQESLQNKYRKIPIKTEASPGAIASV